LCAHGACSRGGRRPPEPVRGASRVSRPGPRRAPRQRRLGQAPHRALPGRQVQPPPAWAGGQRARDRGAHNGPRRSESRAVRRAAEPVAIAVILTLGLVAALVTGAPARLAVQAWLLALGAFGLLAATFALRAP